MANSIIGRLKHAWNAFRDPPIPYNYFDLGPSYSYRPDLLRLNLGNERSIISSVFTRIGIDVASIPLRHVRLDQNGRFLEIIDSAFNECLSVSANIDQTGRAFMQDVVMSLCDEGAVAIVPVDTSINPSVSGSYDIHSMRTGRIKEWFPSHVRVDVYNEKHGMREEITLPKKLLAIIENPLYSVMNEPNSTLKRLISKLNILDAIDIQSGSGKLDLIFQLPYVIKTPTKKAEAEKRRLEIEEQLANSKYGIAYVDGTERVTQLNRPAENNLMIQIEYLSRMLYGQLGLTEAIFNGTASEEEILNYYSRTVEPILSAITDGMIRAFLTKTARTQGQSIKHFRDPFKLVPAEKLASIADTLTRNEVLTSNEMRDVLGYKPSSDAGADSLRNKNLNPSPAPSQLPSGEKPKVSNDIDERKNS